MTLLALYSGNDFAVKMKDSRITKVSQLQKIPETILIFNMILEFFIQLYQEFLIFLMVILVFEKMISQRRVSFRISYKTQVISLNRLRAAKTCREKFTER